MNDLQLALAKELNAQRLADATAHRNRRNARRTSPQH
jgi:hypothetical protein